ncbi:polysaccharide deacetylase family protein [Embleya sp. NBC_00888]|uniref:polysaccharide deacetylase family protein n=1 Tax=Embleya sp. NBC_00888 TaxID=2975960 RepID=UPI00387061FC|nr:polysaccharide deacetylase family protein [Embleya sp. NBC_00888]
MYRISTQDKVAFLTIDDGAYKDPEMIRVLREAGIKPTLFLTDQYAKQDPGFLRRMRDETGGAIENHTLDHPNLRGKPYDTQKNQICGTSDAYEREFGKRPTLLRPPYGNHDENTMRAADDCGVTHVVHWSAEIQKGRMQFAVGDKLRPGDIVLMHFRKEFKEDIQSFIDQTRAAGLTPALLEDYLE